jgi:hypothetical protein
MATKSTALPGLMRGSTVGTGTVKPQAPAKPATPPPAKTPKPSTPKPKTDNQPNTDSGGNGVPTLVSTYEDATTGDVIAVYSDGSTKILSYGNKVSTNADLLRKNATTTQAIIKNKLAELQIPSTLIDSSTTFITSLVNDGLDVLSAVDVYYNNKSWTAKDGSVLNSPFYAEYTYLQESAPKTGNPPTPLELMQFKLGVQNLVTQYGRSKLFSEDIALKNYISNNVRLTDLDARFAEAGVASVSADPMKVATLKKLGYITDTQDVADFLLDPKIGQQQFEINRNTAAFAQQALKRAGSGISFDAERMKQLAATAGVTQGTAAGAENVGSIGYETIALQLNPLTKIESIYGKPTDATGKNLTDVQVRSQLQTELEAEQFQGTASERRKRRIEEEQLAYQRKSGTVTGGSGASISLGRGGITGAL